MPESKQYMTADTGGSCLKKSDSQLKVKKSYTFVALHSVLTIALSIWSYFNWSGSR